MSLEVLPNELLFSIAELLSTQRDLNSFARSSRKLYAHVNPFLYQRNIKSGRVSALVWAAEIGREGTAIRALDAGAHVDTKNNHRDGPSALHVACANGHPNVVSVLLTRDASIQVTTSKGLTPLHVACFYKQAPIVELLLNYGAPISTPSASQETALHYALRAPHLNSSPHHRPGPGWTYPTSARRRKPPLGSTLSTVSLLLAHGANPLDRDRGGTSPESLAKQHFDPEVRALIRHAVASMRHRAEQLDAKTRRRGAREEAREKERLEMDRQERLAGQREEAEAEELEVKKKMREGEERCAREREAERQREEKLLSGREIWSRLRESADKRDCGEGSGALSSRGFSSWSATTGCKHSSPVWLKKRGKGQCGLCSKGCEKHSLQCPDCGLVACTTCKAKSSLTFA